MNTSTTPEQTNSLADFIPKKAFTKKFPELMTESEFEWLFKNRKNNGFDKAFKMIGKKPYAHIPTVHDLFINR